LGVETTARAPKFTPEERKQIKEYLIEKRPILKKLPRRPDDGSSNWQVAI